MEETSVTLHFDKESLEAIVKPPIAKTNYLQIINVVVLAVGGIGTIIGTAMMYQKYKIEMRQEQEMPISFDGTELTIREYEHGRGFLAALDVKVSNKSRNSVKVTNVKVCWYEGQLTGEKEEQTRIVRLNTPVEQGLPGCPITWEKVECCEFDYRDSREKNRGSFPGLVGELASDEISECTFHFIIPGVSRPLFGVVLNLTVSGEKGRVHNLWKYSFVPDESSDDMSDQAD